MAVYTRSVRRRIFLILVAGALSLPLAAMVRADVFVLKEGDRVTGSITGETRTAILVRTPYGTLTIPRHRILRIMKSDGSDRAFTVPEDTRVAAAIPTPTPAPKPRLVLIVGGKSFWYAWEEKDAPEDPGLRFLVSLDEQPVATYVDSVLQPGEIKGAVVNAFGFDGTNVSGENAAQVANPDVQPGRISLRIDPLSVRPGDRLLRLAYQINEGKKAAAIWRDVASTSLHVTLKSDGPTILRADQEPGRLEFAGRGRRAMKNLDTFRLTVAPETP